MLICVVFVRQRSANYSSLCTVFRYNPQTNITRGIIFGNRSVPAPEIISEFEKCPHPLLLPLLSLEVTLSHNVDDLVKDRNTIWEMEDATGYGIRGDGEDEVNFVDYRTMVKSLSQARSGICVELSDLRLTHTCVGYILKKLPFVDERLSPAVRDTLRESSSRLQERAEYTMSAIEHAIESGHKERLDGHHATVCPFNV